MIPPLLRRYGLYRQICSTHIYMCVYIYARNSSTLCHLHSMPKCTQTSKPWTRSHALSGTIGFNFLVEAQRSIHLHRARPQYNTVWASTARKSSVVSPREQSSSVLPSFLCLEGSHQARALSPQSVSPLYHWPSTQRLNISNNTSESAHRTYST